MGSENLQSFTVPGAAYGYTGTPVNTLTSFENTLVQCLLDESGSTNSYAADMEACVKEIIMALRASPRADNLMYRQCHFATGYREFHGWKPLGNINPEDYTGCYKPGGSTALYDSDDRALKELRDYAQQQAKMKYLCNGFYFNITDGRDWPGSTLKPSHVHETLKAVVGDESLESLVTVLIGVNPAADVQHDLENYAKVVGYTQYIPLNEANAKNLKRMATFISASVAAQSQALGSGGPSQSLTF